MGLSCQTVFICPWLQYKQRDFLSSKEKKGKPQDTCSEITRGTTQASAVLQPQIRQHYRFQCAQFVPQTICLVHLALQLIFPHVSLLLVTLNKRTFMQTLELTDYLCAYTIIVKSVKCISCSSDITCSITSWHYAPFSSLIPSSLPPR